MKNSAAIERLLKALMELPGLGPKSAERIVHYLLGDHRQAAVELAASLQHAIDSIRPCRECFNLTDQELCPICSDSQRDAGMVCVVEAPRDVSLFERAGNYRGLYHVLGGRLAPLENVGPEHLTIVPLVRRVRAGGVREVILATSPTLEGDGTALLVSTALQSTGVKVTRLARGLPAGASLELMNAQILADALDGRQTY